MAFHVLTFYCCWPEQGGYEHIDNRKKHPAARHARIGVARIIRHSRAGRRAACGDPSRVARPAQQAPRCRHQATHRPPQRPAPEGIGKTGVVGVLKNGPGPTVWFRADMDSNAVREATGLPWAATKPQRLADGTEIDVMHACGHDAHVTWLLGLA